MDKTGRPGIGRSRILKFATCDRDDGITANQRVLKVREVILLTEREESDLSAAEAYDLTKAGSVY